MPSQIPNSSDGTFTPPPSYAIFIGSGESDLIPPSYKMLFPPSYSNSFESAGSTVPDSHSKFYSFPVVTFSVPQYLSFPPPVLNMPSTHTSNDLMDLNTPTHSETPSSSTASSMGFPTSVSIAGTHASTSTSTSAFKLFPTSQIAIVCEAAHFPPSLGLHFQQQQQQQIQQQQMQQQQGHLSITNIGPISSVSTTSNGSHYTNASSTYEEGSSTAHAQSNNSPLPLAAINPRFGSHGGILQGSGSQYLYFPFVHARHPSARTSMVPRSGSEDVIPMASMPEERNEADIFGEDSPVFTSERARMRRGSSF